MQHGSVQAMMLFMELYSKQTNGNRSHGWEPPKMELTSVENTSVEELLDPYLSRIF